MINRKIKGVLFKSSGYTLIEVFIGIFLLTIGMLALAEMHIMTIKTNKTAGQRTAAITLAQDKAESLRTIPYSQIGSPPLSDTSGIYARSWTVEDNTPAKNMKRITITVSWTGKQVQMQTIIAAGDL
jgi:type IV pilus modification protein PilV